MTRMLVFDAADNILYELSPKEVMTAYVTEEVGGEHCLDIATTRKMNQAQRIVVDVDGSWREYVVVGVDELHDSGYTAIGSYHAVWSVQYDLSTVYGEEQRPGVVTPVTAPVALQAALNGTSRWTVGTVTVTGSNGLEMYNNSAWERVCGVSEKWGGEVDVEITVGANKVTDRRVRLMSAVGSSTVTRRFDWARDITSIRRKPQEGPRYCRVKPVGKGEESGDGYGRKITIGPVNGGNDWIQDNAAAALYRVPDGSGGWEYPTLLVENPDIDDRQKLKEWATAHLYEWTRPIPTYEAGVLQYAAAGMDVQGVSLGDVVHIVDRGFGDEELRLEGRIVRKVTSLLDKSDAQLTVGQVGQRFSKSLGAIAQSVGEVKSMLGVMYADSGGSPTTSEYVSWLVQQVNARLNATGGYTYLKEGEGIWIYDKAEDQNPTKVINLTGGALRIADSKTSGGDWDWKTVMTASEGLLASAVTAAELTAGFIGSPSGNYWNLDTGELRMQSTAYIDGKTIQQYTDERAQAKADAAVAVAVAGIDADISNLQDQIDGAIETWFYSGVPTLSNQPASSWTTDDDKNNHLGDLYYDSATGKAYRFQLSNGTYSWQVIADSDIAKALSLSSEKKRVFYAASSSHPNPPYDVNDLWVQGGNGDILRCQTAKTSGQSYAAADWVKASKYTDDTATENLDDYLMQEQVFDRLCPINPATGKRPHGLNIDKGRLYLNAEYINSGSITANRVKAGVLQGDTGQSNWNLNTGKLTTVDGTLTNCSVSGTLTSGTSASIRAIVNGGNMQFYNRSTKTMWLKASSKFKDGNYGGSINFAKYLIFAGPRIAVTRTPDKSGEIAFTGTVHIKNLRYKKGSKNYSNGYVKLRFVNGLLVNVPDYRAGCCTVSRS